MTNRSLIIIVAILELLAGEFQAAAQFSRLHFGGYRIVKLAPTSTRSVTGAMELDCTNDTTGFTMSNISGTIYKNGKPFLRGDLSPIKVPHGNTKVLIDCHYAALAEGIGIMDVIKSISFRPQDYTVDISATVIDSKGKKKNVAKQGVGLTELMGKRK